MTSTVDHKVAPLSTSSSLPEAAYTIRALVTTLQVGSGEDTQTLPPLKRFAHFTLGCTATNRLAYVQRQLQVIQLVLKNQPLILQATGVAQMANGAWAVTLALPDPYRLLLSDCFDRYMAREGKFVFLWQADETRPESTYNDKPHVTIGGSDTDKSWAESWVGYQVVCGRLDYKQLGPHDPLVTLALGQTDKNV